MDESRDPRRLDYAAPGSRWKLELGGAHLLRRFALGIGFGVLCAGAGLGFARNNEAFETAWAMGVGAALVGFALPAPRR